MVNFHDPSIIKKDLLILRNLNLITTGIYIWEFLTTLGYEVNIIRGRRPYRWTIWIYSFVRITALLAVILEWITEFSMAPINCQVLITSEVLFGYLSLFAASFLIVIRIFAIWNKNKIAVTIASSVWLINVLVSIRGIALLRFDWNPALLQCIELNPESIRLNIIILVITDIVLLLTMLIGLLRLRSDGGARFGVGHFLWKQGVVWFLLATLAEVPPAVLMILNLNGPINLMFQYPSVITLIICATRMYRSLSDFVSCSTDIIHDDLPKLSNEVPTSRRSQPSPIGFNWIESTVDTTHEQYQRRV